MADGKLLSSRDELALREMRKQLASMRRALDLLKNRRERAQRADFVGYGRITGSSLIGGESNRWDYEGVITVEDNTADLLTYIDTAETWEAQNRAEEHNNGSGQESNGVSVGGGVALIPIMNGRVVELYRRRRSGLLVFDKNNDVE